MLILLSPLLLISGILVWLTTGWPIFFCQERPGLNGRIFTLYKFRTMKNATRRDGTLLPDAERLTPFGKFLRSTSVDELPELINVLIGQMSLVGPRPLLPEYLDRYTPAQARRHEVRPGLTGWAQVNGRNAISWEKRFDLDVWYVDHHSILLDAQIMFLTLAKVFKREGISQAGEATMQPFMGSETPAVREDSNV